MRLLQESAVEAGEIDALGHMNVRFYLSRAIGANRRLLSELGLTPEAVEGLGATLVQADAYTRYHREQFTGSLLEVYGGVLDVGDNTLQTFLELRNDAKDQIAATFILVTALVDRATRKPVPLPRDIRIAAEDEIVALPEHGRPRTADLSPPRTDLSFEDVAGRLGDASADPMSWRMERVVEPEACDEHGFLTDTEDFIFGQLRNQPPKEGERWGPMTFTTDEGHRFGWASLETRNLRLAQPRAGDVLRSLGAEIGLGDKVRHSRRWVFNVTSGEVVSMNDNIALALDLDARRPIAIPAKVRGELEKRHLPEFA